MVECEFLVAGVTFRRDESRLIADTLAEGNAVSMRLVREPENPHDACAIRVEARPVAMDGEPTAGPWLHVGFVPNGKDRAGLASVLAPLLDVGAWCEVIGAEGGRLADKPALPWLKVTIRVQGVDDTVLRRWQAAQLGLEGVA